MVKKWDVKFLLINKFGYVSLGITTEDKFEVTLLFRGWVAWGEIKNKANSAQLKLDLD